MATLFARLFKRREPFFAVAKASAQPPSRQVLDQWERLYQQGRAIQPPYDPMQLLVLAETNEVHAAALQAVATDVAGRGWDLEPRDRRLRLVDPEVRQAVREEIEQLSPMYTFTELLLQAAWELAAIGWAAWEVVRDDEGRVAAIYPMPAQTVRLTIDPDVAVQEKDGLLRYFKRFGSEGPVDGPTGEKRETDDPASEIVWFMRYSPRSRYGVPHWIACAAAIAEYNAIRDYSIAFFESSGTIGRMLILKAADRMTVQQHVDLLSTSIQAAVGKHHGTLVVGMSSGVEHTIEKINPDIRETTFLRWRESMVKSILIAHTAVSSWLGGAGEPWWFCGAGDAERVSARGR